MIVAAEQIAFEDVEAGAIARDKGAVPQIFDEQRVRERQHQRHVGADFDRQPPGAGRFRHVVAQRRDAVEYRAAARGPLHRVALDVPADAAACDIRILQRHAAEGQHRIGMLGDLIPGHVVARDGLIAAHHMRQDHGRGAGAVAVHRAHIAAERCVQKAMNLALRVVETSGAGPAVGATEDRGSAIFRSDPRQFIRKQIEHFVPGARNELLVEDARAVCAPVQPRLAHHRPQNAGLVAHRGRKVLQDRGGRGVLRVGLDIQRRAVPSRRKRAPVRAVWTPIFSDPFHVPDCRS